MATREHQSTQHKGYQERKLSGIQKSHGYLSGDERQAL